MKTKEDSHGSVAGRAQQGKHIENGSNAHFAGSGQVDIVRKSVVCWLWIVGFRIWTQKPSNVWLPMTSHSRAIEQNDLLRPRLVDMGDARRKLAKLATLIGRGVCARKLAGFSPRRHRRT